MGAPKRIYGRVTEEAWGGWHGFATRHRVSVAALVQAIGEALAAGRRVITADVVERAAEVDRERRLRE